MKHPSHSTKTEPPRTITFICINYHCSELTRELVNSLSQQGDPNIHCLIIDNSQGDPGLFCLESRREVTVLYAERNLGFGGGCNIALKHLNRHDPNAIAWIINPDARLLPGAINTVRSCLEHPAQPALLGTRIIDTKGKIWFDNGRFNKRLGTLNHMPKDPSECKHNTSSSPIESSDWVSGCSLILDLGSLLYPPLFDEQIFLYYEDAELCLRLREQGIQPFVTRDILVAHSVSATTSRRPIQKYRHATFGKLYLLHKHSTLLAITLNLCRFYARALVQIAGDPAQAIGRVIGATHYLAWAAGSITSFKRQ